MTDQNQLLENWQSLQLTRQMFSATYVNQLLQAQEAKTREEERKRASDIVDNMFGFQIVPRAFEIRDYYKFSNFLYKKMNKDKEKAQQQILDLNNNENEK